MKIFLTMWIKEVFASRLGSHITVQGNKGTSVCRNYPLRQTEKNVKVKTATLALELSIEQKEMENGGV